MYQEVFTESTPDQAYTLHYTSASHQRKRIHLSSESEFRNEWILGQENCGLKYSQFTFSSFSFSIFKWIRTNNPFLEHYPRIKKKVQCNIFIPKYYNLSTLIIHSERSIRQLFPRKWGREVRGVGITVCDCFQYRISYQEKISIKWFFFKNLERFEKGFLYNDWCRLWITSKHYSLETVGLQWYTPELG